MTMRRGDCEREKRPNLKAGESNKKRAPLSERPWARGSHDPRGGDCYDTNGAVPPRSAARIDSRLSGTSLCAIFEVATAPAIVSTL
jgi:hypothetical protein